MSQFQNTPSPPRKTPYQLAVPPPNPSLRPLPVRSWRRICDVRLPARSAWAHLPTEGIPPFYTSSAGRGWTHAGTQEGQGPGNRGTPLAPPALSAPGQPAWEPRREESPLQGQHDLPAASSPRPRPETGCKMPSRPRAPRSRGDTRPLCSWLKSLSAPPSSFQCPHGLVAHGLTSPRPSAHRGPASPPAASSPRSRRCVPRPRPQRAFS